MHRSCEQRAHPLVAAADDDAVAGNGPPPCYLFGLGYERVTAHGSCGQSEMRVDRHRSVTGCVRREAERTVGATE